ncbi:pseudaminic acid cytidylyltransferase [Algibacter sp. L4_22]|uniref:pseudaminic acid cytidylyltransferase n=1 Tax=Algibacter sp. L4_22 TaxID=2942477 RepID=UPI00201B880B|nr:pseudaminic acid cytidylyltransferase [Algibacter sp. L4_22]MCL5127249.1 pseudaminic acid cytidylyltransferase [Algibacter sp. L4_22]
MANLAIIPARGGSKRIPRKNIKHFLGKPIIAYSIEAALKSGLFDEVIVSTDDAEIANVAEQYGAKIVLRSQKNSDDFATLADVIEEVKNQYISNKIVFDSICCILATAPLITPDIIKKGYTNLEENNADSVRPVVRFAYPIQRAFKLDEGKVSFINKEHASTRSQDLEPAFFDSGMFYWMRFELGLKGTNRYAFEIAEMQAQDIDTLEDWQMAELKYKLNNQ